MPLKRPTTTPLPDEIYDEWAPRLGEAELKVLLYIVRRTLGFRKGADAISLSQFLHGIVTHDGRVLDRGCGVKSRPNVVRALKGLEDKGLIHATRERAVAGDNDVTVYALRWETDENGGTSVQGSVAAKLQGGVERTPRWYRSDREVVPEQNHGGVAAKPTTNRSPTNSQHDSVPTGTTTPHTREHRCGALKDVAARNEARPSPEASIIWGAVLEDLRATMTAENYDRWFAPTVARQLQGQALTIVVPTDMHCRWLGVRLRPRIDDALQRLRYTDVRVTFTVAGDEHTGTRRGDDDIAGRRQP